MADMERAERPVMMLQAVMTSRPCQMPHCPTTQVSRRNSIVPQMFSKHLGWLDDRIVLLLSPHKHTLDPAKLDHLPLPQVHLILHLFPLRQLYKDTLDEVGWCFSPFQP